MKYHLFLTHTYFVDAGIKRGKQLWEQDKLVGQGYDITSLASQIEHYTSIDDQPGKLTFILEKDPNDMLEISEGDLVEFYVTENNKDYYIFKGYVFIIGTDSTEAYKITAYDQTRYLKNTDTMAVNNMSLNMLFIDICKRNSLTNYVLKDSSNTILPDKIYNDKSYYDILKQGIDDTLLDTNRYFFIRDNFGTLELNELMNSVTDYVIGDESLLTDYQYEVNIDKDTYNKVKMVKTNKDTNSLEIASLWQDLPSINKIGVLRKTLVLPDGADNKFINNKARSFIDLHKHPLKTIRLNAIGVPDLNAGDGFLLRLNKLRLEQWMWITSAVHHYDGDTHTMDLEVSGLLQNLQSFPSRLRKTNRQVAQEVIDGLWGVGEDRKNRLWEQGYNYDDIQRIVNIILQGS